MREFERIHAPYFQTRCMVQDKVCSLIVDREINIDFASDYLVEKLGLVTTPHPTPYKLPWTKETGAITVTKQVEVLFRVGRYEDMVLCDVVPMSTTHIMLGHKWEKRKQALFKVKNGNYTIHHHGHPYYLLTLSFQQAFEDQRHMQEKVLKFNLEREAMKRVWEDVVPREEVPCGSEEAQDPHFEATTKMSQDLEGEALFEAKVASPPFCEEEFNEEEEPLPTCEEEVPNVEEEGIFLESAEEVPCEDGWNERDVPREEKRPFVWWEDEAATEEEEQGEEKKEQGREFKHSIDQPPLKNMLRHHQKERVKVFDQDVEAMFEVCVNSWEELMMEFDDSNHVFDPGIGLNKLVKFRRSQGFGTNPFQEEESDVIHHIKKTQNISAHILSSFQFSTLNFGRQ